MFCISFLAYGDEHINEFNIVANSLLQLDSEIKILVVTDSAEKITGNIFKIIEIDEPFNYNLKRIVIEESFKEFDTVLFLDTDVFIRNGIDFTSLNNLSDGMYVTEIVGLKRLRDVYGSLEYMKDYLNELKTIYDEELFLVHEGLFVIKISDSEQKNTFIKHWKDIDEQTRPHHKLAYDLPGAMEGLIIWIALQKSNIKVEFAEDELKKTTDLIYHFGARNRKMERTLI
jgi:hypothetical protein